MNARWSLLVAAVVFLGVGAATVRAHEEGSDMKGGMHEHMTRMLKDRLGMTDDQVAKFQSLIKSKRETEKPLRQELREGVKKLHAQLTLKQSDSELKSTMDQIAKTRKELAASREKFRSQMDELLTVQQRAKVLVATAARHRGHGRFGREHGRFGPGHEGAWGPGKHHHGDKSMKGSEKEDPAPPADEPSEE